MALPGLAYLDVDDFRTRTGAPSTYTDAFLEGFLYAAETAVEFYLGYPPQLTEDDVSEYFNGDGTALLVLNTRWPVTEVVSVKENWSGYFQSDNFTADTLLTEGVDYAVANVGNSKAATLYRIKGVWPYAWGRPVNRLAPLIGPCLGCVKVTYNGGLDEGPMELVKAAAYMEAAALYASRVTGSGIQTSAGMDGYNLSINPNGGALGDIRPRFLSMAAQIMLRPLKAKAISR